MEEKNKIVNKPISLILEDSKQTIIDAINSVNLQPYFLELILKDIYNEVYQQKLIQCNQERIAYEKLLIEKEQEEQK
jgi:hypothetical protein